MRLPLFRNPWLLPGISVSTFMAQANAGGTRAAPRMSRNALIVGCVLVFHVLAIWALQTGLLHRAVQLLVPVEMISEIIEPPKPVELPPPVKQPPPAVVKKAMSKPTPPQPAPAPVLQAVPNPGPAPNAPTAVVAPPQPLPAITAPVSVAPAAPPPAPPAPPAPPRVELPSSDAEYLQNPKPTYPALSKRLRETGTVWLTVLVGADGQPQKVDLKQSSGFDRLDQSALQAVAKWRFVPGKRGGVPATMPFAIPLTFNLD